MADQGTPRARRRLGKHLGHLGPAGAICLAQGASNSSSIRLFASAEPEKATVKEASVDAITSQVQTMTVTPQPAADGRVSEVLTASAGDFYGFPYHAFVAQAEKTEEAQTQGR